MPKYAPLTLQHLPTPDQVQTVIDNLKKIEAIANQLGAFDMGESYVSAPRHACGTVHCVAGWYAVANQDRPEIKQLIDIKKCDYLDGALLMADDLGFISAERLAVYMGYHPAIWGNDYGALMFAESRAYTGLKFSDKPITHIIKHWQKVKKITETIKAV